MSGAPPRHTRVMPNDLAAEQAVLGGCLLRPAAAVDILEGVAPELFHSPAHQAIVDAMPDLVRAWGATNS